MAADKKIVLITGANSGIGLETVISLAQASPDYHILLGARSLEKGQQALAEIHASASLQSPISLLQLDITDAASIAAAKTHIEQHHAGRLDVLVNNAGILPLPHQQQQQPDEPTLALLRRTFETNVFAPWVLTEALEPLLRRAAEAEAEAGGGAPLVVHVSSGQGSITLKLDATNPHAKLPGEHYRASKAALNMLAACHRVAFKAWGCRVCAFDPGFCVTNLTGKEGRQMRIKMGARPAKEPADELVNIILGKRDAHFEVNGMMDVDGKIEPW